MPGPDSPTLLHLARAEPPPDPGLCGGLITQAGIMVRNDTRVWHPTVVAGLPLEFVTDLAPLQFRRTPKHYIRKLPPWYMFDLGVQ